MKTTIINTTEFPDYDNHEVVVEAKDSDSGLHAFVAIHNRNLGPALGGCRMWPYRDRDAAITDVLRLSRGMTYKSAMAELPLGGGKAVIIGDPRADKTEALMTAMGRFVNSLHGRYITAEDSGTSVPDLEIMQRETRHVAGVKPRLVEGEMATGDPSPATAYGVFVGIKASIRQQFGSDDLRGRKVAIQGVGNVGHRLARHLAEAGAQVYVADLFEDALNATSNAADVEVVPLDQIHRLDVDVFAPCALGGSINPASLREIKASVIAGAANNQLANSAMGEAIRASGKLYAPDYVINAGGIIDIYYERVGYDYSNVRQHIDGIARNLTQVYLQAARKGRQTNQVADELAELRFKARDAA